MKTIFTLISLFCVLDSCKKDYVCKCTDWNNPSATYRTIHDTKENAKEKCEQGSVIPEMGCKLQLI